MELMEIDAKPANASVVRPGKAPTERGWRWVARTGRTAEDAPGDGSRANLHVATNR
jgi:hypothetical protein